MQRLAFFLASILFLTTPEGFCDQDNLPERDSRAITVLQQAMAAMGGVAPNDFMFTGSVAIAAGSKLTKGRIRILVRGVDQILEQLDTEDGFREFVHAKGRLEVREHLERKKLPLEQAFSTQLPTPPHVILAAAMRNPDTSYVYLGVEDLAGTSAHRIRFWNTFASRKVFGKLAQFTTRDIWIDLATGFPVKLAYEQRAGSGAADRMQMEITYSDYRLAGGITVPFRMEIWRNGVNWTTIAIEQVQSNVGLSEAEFSIR